MKKRNQILALTAAVTVLSASTAMAEYVEGREPIDRGEGVMTTAVSTARDYAVVVNGVQLEKKGYMDGDKVMIPLRAIAEALGFEVEWVGESESVWLQISSHCKSVWMDILLQKQRPCRWAKHRLKLKEQPSCR